MKKSKGRNHEYVVVMYLFLAIFVGIILYYIYFMAFQRDTFINNPYNSLQNLFGEHVVRGEITDCDGNVLAKTKVGENGQETRVYPYENLFAHVVGFSTNGKSGLENVENFELLRSHEFFLQQFADQMNDEKSLMDPDQQIKRNIAFCICEIVNKGPQNAQKFVDIHGLGVLVDFIANVKGEPRRYGINALGFIAAHDEKLAEAAIDAQAVVYLKNALETETSSEIVGAACYALGQIGKHAPKHAGKVAEQQVLALMLSKVLQTEGVPDEQDLNKKARNSLQKIILNCRDLKALEPLIKIAPSDILVSILEQYRKYLKDDKDFKRDFVSEGLKYLQIKKCEKDCPKEVSDAIDRVNENFSQEVINLYSPQYGEKLLADFEKNNPND